MVNSIMVMIEDTMKRLTELTATCGLLHPVGLAVGEFVGLFEGALVGQTLFSKQILS